MRGRKKESEVCLFAKVCRFLSSLVLILSFPVYFSLLSQVIVSRLTSIASAPKERDDLLSKVAKLGAFYQQLFPNSNPDMAPPRTTRGGKNARGGVGTGAGKRGGRGGGGRDRSTYSAGGSAGGGFSEIPKSAVDQDSASDDEDGLGRSLTAGRH